MSQDHLEASWSPQSPQKTIFPQYEHSPQDSQALTYYNSSRAAEEAYPKYIADQQPEPGLEVNRHDRLANNPRPQPQHWATPPPWEDGQKTRERLRILGLTIPVFWLMVVLLFLILP